MSLFSTIGGRILAKTGVDLIRRVAREAEIKRKAERKGYLKGFSDAKAGKESRYVSRR